MLNQILSKILSPFQLLDDHSKEVVKKSSFTLLVKIFGMIGGVFVSVFIGRTLGADGLGVINLANRVTSILLVLSVFGTKEVLVKHISIGFEKKDWQFIGSRIYSVTLFTGTTAFLISIIGYLIAPSLSKDLFNSSDLIFPLQIAFIALLPQTLSRVFASGLIGFRKIWQSNLVNETLSMLVISILLISSYLLGYSIDLFRVAIVYAIGRFFVTVSVYFYWRNVFSYTYKKVIELKPVLKMAFPLLLVSSTSIIASNADTIMIGWLSTTREVGLYNVAARLALLVSLFLQVTNAALSPKLAALFEQKRIDEMQRMVRNVTTGLLVIAAFSLLFFIGLGKQVLTLWGTEFNEAYMVLVILAAGQFFNISTGCAGLLLIMCGQEKAHGYISVSFVTLNLVLNFFLITEYGAIGAALATTLTVSFENITKLILAKRKIGVLTLPSLNF